MPIIKHFEPRTDEIKQLEFIFQQLTTDQKIIKNKVLQDLKQIRLGDKGEKNAAYLLGEIYRDEDAILINGLRLEKDDQVAQIDHLTINRLGIVTLYETKNFSTGLKISDDGRFWYWSASGKDYKEMPSPIKQSERHESLLKKVFTEIGFVETSFRHFVIVDYQAELIKPKKGFEQVCRPDRVQEARVASNNGATIPVLLKALGKLVLGKSFNAPELISIGNELLAYHRPLQFDYSKKYSFAKNNIAEDTPEYDLTPESNTTFYTQSQLAKNLSMTNQQLEAALLDLGWFEKRGKYNYLTESGKSEGIRFQKAKQGYFYYLFPIHFAKKLENAS